jgi:hypothetical protein
VRDGTRTVDADHAQRSQAGPNPALTLISRVASVSRFDKRFELERRRTRSGWWCVARVRSFSRHAEPILFQSSLQAACRTWTDLLQFAPDLIFAEQKFRRIVECKALPKLIAILEAQTRPSKAVSQIA